MRSREEIIKRVRHLLDRTMANGCTEAEADLAATMAAALMRQYAITDGDLSMTIVQIETPAKPPQWFRALVTACIHACNCAGLWHIGNRRLDVVGVSPGPEIAHYLAVVCERAAESAVETFRASAVYRARRKPTTRRAALADFRTQFAVRLARRVLLEFRGEMDDVRRDAARRHLDTLAPNAAPMKYAKDRRTRFDAAAKAGAAAADGVGLHRGVAAGSAKPKLIGGARG
jgi:hypothetical protein